MRVLLTFRQHINTYQQQAVGIAVIEAAQVKQACSAVVPSGLVL